MKRKLSFIALLLVMLCAAATAVAAETSPQPISATDFPATDSVTASQTMAGSDTLNSADSSGNGLAVEDSDTTKIVPWKLGLVMGSVSLTYIGSYILVFQKGWWDGEDAGFHFKNDFGYAMNLDKGGHFFSGVLMGEFFKDGLMWSGVSEKSSYLLGGVFAGVSHVGIDVKDGFAEWGFSIFDVMSGTIGGFYPMFKRYSPLGPHMDLKLSYWINTDAYWKGDHVSSSGVPTDDYPNQTYWVVWNINNTLPRSLERFWPDWLGLATGISVDENVEVKGIDGSYEFYIGPDWDLAGLIKPESATAKKWVRYLNYIKFPAPTFQLYPKFAFHWAYPIIF